MQSRHVINDDLYTNSLLICPDPQQDQIIEFFWVKRGSPFSSREKHIISSSQELYYQCTLLDYLATIQLNVVDKLGNGRVYVFGPIKLQLDLHLFQKSQIHPFSVRIILSKKESIESVARIEGHEKNVKIQFELENRCRFNLPCSDNKVQDIDSRYRIEEGSFLEVSFSQEKKKIIEVLKKLKIYSYQGNFLKLLFKSERQRDLFLVEMLTKIGFCFQKNSFKSLSHHRSISTTTELTQHYFQQIPLLRFRDQNYDIENKINHSNRQMKKQKSDLFIGKKFMHESVKPTQNDPIFCRQDKIKTSIKQDIENLHNCQLKIPSQQRKVPQFIKMMEINRALREKIDQIDESSQKTHKKKTLTSQNTDSLEDSPIHRILTRTKVVKDQIRRSSSLKQEKSLTNLLRNRSKQKLSKLLRESENI